MKNKSTDLNNFKAEEIFEALKTDTQHPFSEETLKQISEAIANAEFPSKPMSFDEFMEWFESV
jgi:hypothetical protein